MKRERLLLVCAVLVGCALLAEALWRGPFFPSNDGPHHVFGAYARAHIDDPDKNYAAYLTPHVPVTANGFADLFSLFEPLLGVRDAERATLALTCMIFLVGAVLLAHALHPRRAWLGLVAGAAGLGWPLLLGFYEFVLACGLAFFVVVFGLRATRPAQRALLAVLLFVVALVHFSVAFLAGGLLLLLRVANAEHRRAELGLMLVTLLPVLWVVARATGATDNHGDANEVLPFSLRLRALGGCTVAGAPWRQALFSAFAVAGLASCALGWRTRTTTERICAGVAVCGIAAPLVLPWTFLGWQHAAVRALPLCAALAIALVPLERLRGARAVGVALSCVAFLVAATASIRGTLSEAARDLEDVDAALAVPASAGYRLSVVTTTPDWVARAGVLRWDPLRGIGSLFGVVHGGLPAYAHVVSPQAHTLLVRDDLIANLPPPPLRSQHQSRLREEEDPAARAAGLAPLLERARAFESVLAFERPADHALWRAAGFGVVAERGRVLLLAVPPDAPPAAAAPLAPPAEASATPPSP